MQATFNDTENTRILRECLESGNIENVQAEVGKSCKNGFIETSMLINILKNYG
jgi:hypothetical protein